MRVVKGRRRVKGGSVRNREVRRVWKGIVIRDIVERESENNALLVNCGCGCVHW